MMKKTDNQKSDKLDARKALRICIRVLPALLNSHHSSASNSGFRILKFPADSRFEFPSASNIIRHAKRSHPSRP
jgi:hypothetical protein